MVKSMRKVVLGVILTLILAGAIPTIAQASPDSFPMYSWGSNTTGQLGVGDVANRSVPMRIERAGNNWIASATASGGSYAISADGHLYAWGAHWNSAQMGQRNHPNPGSGNILVPTRVDTADNWVQVSTRLDNVAAINSDGEIFRWGAASAPLGNQNAPTRVGDARNWVYVAAGNNQVFAINDLGHLYSWGTNSSSTLGHGASGNVAEPTRVEGRSDWVSVNSGANFTVGVTADGALWAWGANVNGQLGQGNTSTRNAPTRVGEEYNWVDVRATTGAVAAINDLGHLYTWGSAAQGQLGNGTTSGNVNRPTRVEGASNWVAIMGGNTHFLAFNARNQLWAWGANGSGQLGLGDFVSRDTPYFVMQVHGFSTAARGGGAHSIMLLQVANAESYLTKNLQKPEGTNLLVDMNFTFTFERHSFNNDANNYMQVPNIPNRVITLNNASTSTSAAGIATTSEEVNVLEGISFAQAGIYSWIVRELPTTGVTPPSNIVDSLAAYEMRVYITQESIGGPLSVYAVTIHRLYCDDGEAIDPPVKTDDFSFTNIYTRITTGTDDCYGALVISKDVVGQFAPVETVFDFEITITRTAMCPENTTFVGQVYNSDGTVSGSPVTFTSGASTTVGLTHGQRLVFDEFLVGTRFAVTELASLLFIASVDVRADGVPINVAPNTEPNQNLFTGNHLAGDAENSAAFTNTHFYTPPTGIVINNPPLALSALGLTMLAAFSTVRNRKNIEQLPIA